MKQQQCNSIATSYENHSSDLLDEPGWEKLEFQRLKQLAVCIKSTTIFPHCTCVKCLLMFQVYIPTILLGTLSQIVLSPDQELCLQRKPTL